MTDLAPPLGLIIDAVDRAATEAAVEAARLDDPNMLFVDPKDIARHDLRARCLRAASAILKHGRG
jgi:hypothetical protein